MRVPALVRISKNDWPCQRMESFFASWPEAVRVRAKTVKTASNWRNIAEDSLNRVVPGLDNSGWRGEMTRKHSDISTFRPWAISIWYVLCG